MKKNTVIIDVDSTLCEFNKRLYSECIKVNPNITFPYMWDTWDYPSSFMGKQLFYGIVDKVHLAQFYVEAFPLARELMAWLYSRYTVIVASHRKIDRQLALGSWLHRNGLLFDKIYCGFNKSELFTENVAFIFDDSPETLAKAKERGIKAFGIEYSYNRNCGSKLFHNVGDFLGYLMENY